MPLARTWDEYILLASEAYGTFLGYLTTAITRIQEIEAAEASMPSTTIIPWDLKLAPPPAIPSSSLVSAHQSSPSPSPSAHLIIQPSSYASSSSSQGIKRRRAPTLLPDARQGVMQVDVSDEDDRRDLDSHSQSRSAKGGKRMKGA
jgi:hypothetical protein